MAVRQACGRHETRLKDGSRAGFFLGDGEGGEAGHRGEAGCRWSWVGVINACLPACLPASLFNRLPRCLPARHPSRTQ